MSSRGSNLARPISHTFPNQPKELQGSQNQTKEVAIKQEDKSIEETLLHCYPKDFYALLFGIIMVVSAVISIFDFFRTGNTSMLMTLCYMTAGHTGLQGVKHLVKAQWGKQSQED